MLTALNFQLAHLQAGGATVGAHHHFHGGDTTGNGDAFSQSFFHFVLGSGHLVDGSAGDQHHFGAFSGRDLTHVMTDLALDNVVGTVFLVLVLDVAETAGNGCHVDGGITTTDDHHALADVAQTTFVEGTEEGHAGHAVGGLCTGHGQRTASLGAQSDENGVEFFFQLLKGHILTDVDTQLGFHAQVQNTLDFGVEDVTGSTEAGDAVAHHAAEQFVLVEDGHAVALHAELISGGQTGGAATDDGDFLAGFLFGFGELQALGNGVFADVVLDGVDAHAVIHFVAVATGFTGSGANTAHHGGEGVGFGQAAEGVLLHLHACGCLLHATNDVQIATDVLASGAAALAGRSRLDVGRALIGPAGLENLILPATDSVVAILVAAKVQALVHVFRSD